MKGMMVVKPERCMGCGTCELACAVEHSRTGDLVESIRERPAPCSRVMVAQGAALVVPLQCRQCEDAPCAAVCPTAALHRNEADEPVLLDQGLCIGCRNCVQACPFGVIRMHQDARAIIKCDQCFERLQRDELPVCVSSCPIGALEFAEPDDVAADKRRAYLLHMESDGGKDEA